MCYTVNFWSWIVSKSSMLSPFLARITLLEFIELFEIYSVWNRVDRLNICSVVSQIFKYFFTNRSVIWDIYNRNRVKYILLYVYAVAYKMYNVRSNFALHFWGTFEKEFKHSFQIRGILNIVSRSVLRRLKIFLYNSRR